MKRYLTVDANEAVAKIAHKLNEVIAIYPITPASPMGEWADTYTNAGQKNLWGEVPHVIEMQSEGGAAGTVHGALQNGALTTTFTASQGLLLMLPNLFKIAGELTPTVLHVAARTVATHALSIFGDHSDVMAARSTGMAMLCSNSVQEAMDFAAIAHAATLEARLPFIHFFDGFRTSHEIQKIEDISDDVLRNLIREDLITEHRLRSLSSDKPFIRGTAQNPDVFFQAREAGNPYYNNTPAIVQKYMDKFAELTGRQYHLFDYFGSETAEDVLVLMGSGVETAREAAEWLNAQGYNIGILSVRLFRPFSIQDFAKVLPLTTKRISVLDRTKEPGATGEPLYQDVIAALFEARNQEWLPASFNPIVIGGRYGLSSKEFTPAMVKGVVDNLHSEKRKNHFTIGIHDDVSGTSLDYNEADYEESKDVFRALFFGLGSDGTVSANKNSIKIIGDSTKFYCQGYFVYDSKKSGSRTVSHLRFGPRPIHSTYLIQKANFVACHQFNFLQRFDMLKYAEEGAVFLLNSPYSADEVWSKIPKFVQDQILAKKLQFYVIDAETVSEKAGMGRRINTVMQTCFFAISGILPQDQAIDSIKKAIKKTYGKRGDIIVKQNFDAVDASVAGLQKVNYPGIADSTITMRKAATIGEHAANKSDPEIEAFIRNVTAPILSGNGDQLPVSAFKADGTFPSGTSEIEKRCIASYIPILDPDVCIQCGKCAFVCPHAVIRLKAFDKAILSDAPESFKAMKARGKDFPEGTMMSVQVSPEDCTGCELCVEVCPAKNKSNTSLKAINMAPIEEHLEVEKANWDFFLSIPEFNRDLVQKSTIKGSQVLQPLFEFSGACSGCGETPYIKLITQLFGDRMLVANATGCSSIYGGNLPTTPWTKNKDGRGPAWSNSLFEDNAEFGLGYRVAVDMKKLQAENLVKKLASELGDDLVKAILEADQTDETGINEQRKRVEILRKKLEGNTHADAKRLVALADFLVKKSVWIIGGDGWAYDIGYGGLDHVLASGKNVNILVLDTEVYSNTGGQMSKATPLGAVAKFAAGGKPNAKKDLALHAIQYGNVYVARVAMGAKDTQTLKAIIEAEAYEGPSLIIAYSHCIAHGIEMKDGLNQQKLAVESGYWPLFRFNPSLKLEGKNPFQLDCKGPSIPFDEYALRETRYMMLQKIDPVHAKELMKQAQQQVRDHWNLYENMVQLFEPKTEA